MNGWIKLHRKTLENPIVMKDADRFSVWIYLLLNATHTEYPALFKGEKIVLQPGQLITGCISIADKLHLNESKVRRILNEFENDGQIDRQTSNKNSLISVVNWDLYQKNDGQIDEQTENNRRTTEEQSAFNRISTDDKQECNNDDKEKKSKMGEDVLTVSNETACRIKSDLSLSDAKDILAAVSDQKQLADCLRDALGRWIDYRFSSGEGIKSGRALKSLISRAEGESRGSYGRDDSGGIAYMIDSTITAKAQSIPWTRTMEFKQKFYEQCEKEVMR